MNQPKNKQKKRVVIIGMGFGGLEAARALADSDLEVLVLDRRNFHLFQPMLYQVATAMLDQETIATSIRGLTRHWDNVDFRMAEVDGIDFANKRVLVPDDQIAYDYLIIAAGSVTNFFGNTEIQTHAFDLKQLHDAVALRNHILSVYERAAIEPNHEERQALLTFVIVGGGPTGVEFAGSLSELTHHVLNKDFKQLGVEPRIILVESSDHILTPFPRKLRHYAVRRLEKMHVKVLLNQRVTGATAEYVSLKDGSKIHAHTLFWGAGVRAAPLSDNLEVEKSKGGRIPVAADLTLPSQQDVYVIGDLAYYEENGEPLPMVAPVAMQQGEYSGKHILGRETGTFAEEVQKPFAYQDKGSMAVIGRYSAVGITKGATFRGFSAWIAWLILHLYYIIGFRNRLAAVVSWAYAFLLFDKQVRLITRETKASGDDAPMVAHGETPAGAQRPEPAPTLTEQATQHAHDEGETIKKAIARDESKLGGTTSDNVVASDIAERTSSSLAAAGDNSHDGAIFDGAASPTPEAEITTVANESKSD